MSSEKVVQAPKDDGSKKKPAAAAAAAPEEANLDLLEEDDEFEEFPAESQSSAREEEKVAEESKDTAWTGVDEDTEDVQLWGDNWDDDDAHFDDFANQLREEIKKSSQIKAGGK